MTNKYMNANKNIAIRSIKPDTLSQQYNPYEIMFCHIYYEIKITQLKTDL